VRVLLVIDLDADAPYHRATADALHHAADAAGEALDLRVHPSDTLAEVAGDHGDDSYDGVVIGPGSPYRDEPAVWSIVRNARAAGIPLVGT
jgi:CTP synthase (UTP-ammonia lyase)